MSRDPAMLAKYRAATAEGRITERLAALAALDAAEPGAPTYALARMRIHGGARDWEPAIQAAQQVLARAPRSATVWMELANFLAGAERPAEVRAPVDRAVALAPDVARIRLEAARLLVDVGELDHGRTHAAAAAALGSADGHAALARLALWAGDHAHALQHAAAAEVLEPQSGAAARVRAAVELVEGRLDRVTELANRALAVDAHDAEAYALRAEVALGDGRLEDAGRDLTLAIENAGGAGAGIGILRVLLSIEENRHLAPMCLGVSATEDVREAVEILVPDAPRLAECLPDEGRAVLREALRVMHANRSTTPTALRDGVLTHVPVWTTPRHASRRALELIQVAPLARALAELDRVVMRYPASPLPICHRGELHLWAGDATRARADFEAAIAMVQGTRFAWIGLGGVALLEDRPTEALDLLARGVAAMRNTEGPAVFVYRGEALRRLGRFEEARHDLDRAVAMKSSRVGAWVQLAILCHAMGDAAGARAAAARVQAAAPALFEDAAREALGHEVRDEADVARALAHAAFMMRGNRSSTCITYFTAAGELRALELRR